MALSRFYECLEVVLCIALNSGANPISSKEICKSQGVKPRHLEPFLQLLVKKGILKGTKGPKGGYTLAKEKRKITAADIYQAITLNTEPKNQANFHIRSDIILPLAMEINSFVIEKLDSITIEDLCGKISDKKPTQSSSDEFYI